MADAGIGTLKRIPYIVNRKLRDYIIHAVILFVLFIAERTVNPSTGSSGYQMLSAGMIFLLNFLSIRPNPRSDRLLGNILLMLGPTVAGSYEERPLWAIGETVIFLCSIEVAAYAYFRWGSGKRIEAEERESPTEGDAPWPTWIRPKNR